MVRGRVSGGPMLDDDLRLESPDSSLHEEGGGPLLSRGARRG